MKRLIKPGVNRVLFPLYVVFLALMLLGMYILKEHALDEYKLQENKKLVQTFQKQLTNLIQEKQEATLAMAVSLAQNEQLIAAIVQNKHESLDLAKISKSYNLNTVYKNVWIQILDKDGKSFRRSWTENRGDDLAKVRNDVRRILQEKRLLSTISVGKYSISFKSMVPLFHKGEFIGVIELITHFNSIEKKLKKLGYETLVLADKRFEKSLTHSITQHFIDGYYVANFQLNHKFIKLIQKRGVEYFVGAKQEYLEEEHGHIVLKYTLYDSANDPLGYIFVLTNNTIDASVMSSIKVTYGLFSFILFLFLSAVFYLLFDKSTLGISVKTKTYNKKLLLLMSFLFIGFFLITYMLLQLEKEQKLQNFYLKHTKQKLYDYDHVYKKYKDIASLFFETKIDTPKIKEILMQEDKDKAREELYQELQSVYQGVKKYTIKQLHFHTPQNHSFLRFHRPHKYGDDLSLARQTVAYVNRNKEAIDGFEEGKIYNGFRFVFPIFYLNEYLGSVEVSFSALSMLEEYTQNFDVRAAFFMKKSAVQSKVMQEETQNYQQSPLKDFYYEKQINRALLKGEALIDFSTPSTKELQKLNAKAMRGEPFSFYMDDKRHVITFLPLLNPVTKEVVAYLALRDAESFLHDKEFYAQNVLWTIIFLGAIVLLFIYRELLSKKELVALNKRLNQAQEIAHFGNWRLEFEDSMLYWSDEIYKIFELDKESFIPSYNAFIALIHPDDREMVVHTYEDSLITKKPYSIEHKILMADGRVKYVQEYCITYYDMRGEALYSNGTIQDITARKDIENKLREAKKEAEDALASKSQFLANMSHELRTPMNAVIGLGKLLEEMPLGTKQQEMIEKMNRSSKMLLGIINDILDFSKIDAGKLQLENRAFSFDELLSQLEVMFAQSAKEKGLSLVFDKDNKLPYSVMGDLLRLEQVLVNLISNALKFTHEGEVKLSMALLSEQRDVCAKVEFAIEDSGIGITKAQMQELFTPFMQADTSTTREYGGTGLGLVISKNIVEAMGGTIEVQSQKAKGSCFFFTITFDVKEWKKPEEISYESSVYTESLEKLPFLRGLEVLLVEDNEINQEVVLMMLENVGMKADIANNGQEGVDLFRKDPQRYDLILMDLQMPVMSGYDAAKEIRKSDKEIPIIALTAAAMIEDRQKVKAAGMNEHIAKPIEKEELYHVLLQYVNTEAKEHKNFAVEFSSESKLVSQDLQKKIAELQERLQHGEMIDLQTQDAFIQQLEGVVSADAIEVYREALEDFEYDKAVALMQEWQFKENE